MLDEDAINARRNPLTPEMERQKKAEAKNYDGLAKPDQIYGLYNVIHGEVRYFYVGVSIRPTVRWGQHQRVARMGVNTLPEYEHMRFVGVENCFMEVLDATGEFTEAEWRKILEEQGHRLLNVANCVDVKRKKRTTYPLNDALRGLVASPEPRHCEAFLKLMKVKR